MLVFWEPRLALLATPKTGSTAIAAALESLAVLSVQRPPALKHTSVRRFGRFLGPWLEAAAGAPFEVAALMREPRAWLGSWYRYRQRPELTDPLRSTQGIAFDAFVRDWCGDAPPPYAQVGRQSRFLGQGEGVHHLFRYEAIDTFVAFLEDRLGCEIVLPRLNVSPQMDLDLEATTERRLREVAAADFALYDRLAR